MTHLSNDVSDRHLESDTGKASLARFGVRALDLAVVIAMLPIVVPVGLIIAGSLALSTGTACTAQRKIGRDGRQFRVWRFRSPAADADCTPIEMLVRKSSLDELPLLLAVVAGHSSLLRRKVSA